MELEKLIKPELLPKHVAIIMDGNGRWAKKRKLRRVFGHREGVRAVREVTETSRKLGIKVLTLFAFSSENWQRPKDEIEALMELLKEYLIKEIPELLENDIRLSAIGDILKLPKDVVETLNYAMEQTKSCKEMILNLALSYGARDEIANAAKRIAKEALEGKISVESIDKELFSRYLYTNDLPDPDLLIRTSGELRVSNFLLWQIAYTEIYVTDVLWPDFGKEEFLKAILDYQKRERRFGKTSEQISSSSLTK